MSSTFDDTVKEGHVKFKWKSVLPRQKWLVLCTPSSRGPRRLEKFENRAFIANTVPKVIDLTHVTCVDKLSHNTVKIRFANGDAKEFTCDTEADADSWILSLCNECSLQGQHLETKNVFNVYLLPSPNLDLYGECLLEVTIEDIRLADVSDRLNILVTWPLGSLRRFGYDSTKFTFEAGRHCDTGEGNFIFNTMEGVYINGRIKQATAALLCSGNSQHSQQASVRATAVQQAPVSTAPLLPKPRPSLSRPLPPPPTEGTTNRPPPPRPARSPPNHNSRLEEQLAMLRSESWSAAHRSSPGGDPAEGAASQTVEWPSPVRIASLGQEDKYLTNNCMGYLSERM